MQPGSSCAGGRAVVTLSLGSRPFVQMTRPLMEAYATKLGASFHFVDRQDHPALRRHGAQNVTFPTRFLKLPVLTHYLARHARVLYLDDDIVVSPATPDLFGAVPCGALGAAVERHHVQNWHASYWRSACGLYGIAKADCDPSGWQLFNSGLLVLSAATHGPLLSSWRRERLD